MSLGMGVNSRGGKVGLGRRFSFKGPGNGPGGLTKGQAQVTSNLACFSWLLHYFKPSVLRRCRSYPWSRSAWLTYCFCLLVGVFAGFLVAVNLPTFVYDVRHHMYGWTENVQIMVDLIDGCRAVGLEDVTDTTRAKTKATIPEVVVQGEGQSWNHLGNASGAACPYSVGRTKQLSFVKLDMLPRVFMYEPAVNDYASQDIHCEEQYFAGLMRANVTGTLVDTVSEADRIYVSFYAQCFPNQEMGKSQVDLGGRKAGRGVGLQVSPFDMLWQELQEHHEIKTRLNDVFIFSERHWTKKTGFGMPIRQLLKNYPFTILSPEVTNLQQSEIRSMQNLAWLSKHVVIPQPPLVAWPLVDATDPQDRPYKFCFSGTQINKERRILSSVLSQRNDSYTVAGCRKDRKNMQHHLRNNKFSATQQYRSCQMCLIPLGDSLSDRRLFDAMSSGCIPLVTQKMRPLPYASTREVDYRSAIFTLHHRGTEKSIKAQLHRFEHLTPEDLKAQREASVSIAKKLSYSDCGGHTGLVLSLYQLQVQRDLVRQGRMPIDLYSLVSWDAGRVDLSQ